MLSALATLLLTGALFAWELSLSPPATTLEILTAALLSVLLAVNVGLYRWHRTHGRCDIGARNATGIAGLFGACALLCPACLLIPIGFLGTTLAVSAFSVLQPLFTFLALLLAVLGLVFLWPRR